MAKAPEPKLELNTRLLPLFVALLFVLQLVAPYQGWMILLVGLGGAWLIAYLWARSLRRGLRLVREIRFGWAQVGDRLEERFTLGDEAWAPGLWVEVHDHSTLPDYEASVATGVGGNSENAWRAHAVCTRRGAFRLGPTTLRSGDPFGIYTVTLEYPASTDLMVLPPIIPLPNIEIAAGGRTGEGRQRINSLERTVTAAGVRDYVPGDALSWIHWRTTARRDSLFVKSFDSTPTSDWWIVLDLDRRVQIGRGEDSTLEQGVILAASLADRGLRARHAVGLVAHGEDLIWLPPQAGEMQRWGILRALALASGGACSLAELLALMRPALKQRASLILVTPAASGDWVRALLSLRRRGMAPTVLLLDPVSFGGPGDAGATLALLAELGIAHHVITRAWFERPERRPGHQGDWDWRVSATGRAVPLRQPLDAEWKALS